LLPSSSLNLAANKWQLTGGERGTRELADISMIKTICLRSLSQTVDGLGLDIDILW
jgi:hypothetical protein